MKFVSILVIENVIYLNILSNEKKTTSIIVKEINHEIIKMLLIVVTE